MDEELGGLLSHCIRCGFCLEACPTFQVTGNELESPRGRIYLVRSADEGKLRWHEDVKDHLDLCLGCRACETACPSGVEYGAILEIARSRIERESPSIPKRLLLESATRPSFLRTQLTLSHLLPGKRIPGFVSKIISGVPPEANLPGPQVSDSLPELNESHLPPIRGEVYFLEGCVMSVLFKRVHECSKRLLRRAGYKVREVRQGCCGALHAHNGYLSSAENLAKNLISAMDQDLPVVVNSAGCGSTMKDYRKLLPEDPRSVSFSDRVFDLAEFLHLQGFEDQIRSSSGLTERVAYHEACHLVHGQRVSMAPKALIAAIPGVQVVVLPEADLCCGSAGIYNLTEPVMARELLDRKWGHIEGCQAQIVATGNPGCHSWIAQASMEHERRVSVLHTAELLEASFIGIEKLVARTSVVAVPDI